MPEIRIGGCDVGTLEAGKVYNVTAEEAAQLVKDGVAQYCHDADAAAHVDPPASPADDTDEFDPDAGEPNVEEPKEAEESDAPQA